MGPQKCPTCGTVFRPPDEDEEDDEEARLTEEDGLDEITD